MTKSIVHMIDWTDWLIDWLIQVEYRVRLSEAFIDEQLNMILNEKGTFI